MFFHSRVLAVENGSSRLGWSVDEHILTGGLAAVLPAEHFARSQAPGLHHEVPGVRPVRRGAERALHHPGVQGLRQDGRRQRQVHGQQRQIHAAQHGRQPLAGHPAGDAGGAHDLAHGVVRRHAEPAVGEPEGLRVDHGPAADLHPQHHEPAHRGPPAGEPRGEQPQRRRAGRHLHRAAVGGPPGGGEQQAAAWLASGRGDQIPGRGAAIQARAPPRAPWDILRDRPQREDRDRRPDRRRQVQHAECAVPDRGGGEGQDLHRRVRRLDAGPHRPPQGPRHHPTVAGSLLWCVRLASSHFPGQLGDDQRPLPSASGSSSSCFLEVGSSCPG